MNTNETGTIPTDQTTTDQTQRFLGLYSAQLQAVQAAASAVEALVRAAGLKNCSSHHSHGAEPETSVFLPLPLSGTVQARTRLIGVDLDHAEVVVVLTYAAKGTTHPLPPVAYPHGHVRPEHLHQAAGVLLAAAGVFLTPPTAITVPAAVQH